MMLHSGASRKILIFIAAQLVICAGSISLAQHPPPTHPANQKKIDEIKAAIEKASYCKVKEDCSQETLSVCPFGCNLRVNNKEFEAIKKKLNSFPQYCMYECVAEVDYDCIKGKCITTTGLASVMSEAEAIRLAKKFMMKNHPDVVKGRDIRYSAELFHLLGGEPQWNVKGAPVKPRSKGDHFQVLVISETNISYSPGK